VWRFACAEQFSGGDNASVGTAERQVGVSPSEDNLFMTLELVSAQATTDDPDAGRCPGTTIITRARWQGHTMRARRTEEEKN
jgi:hypothetical protein